MGRYRTSDGLTEPVEEQDRRLLAVVPVREGRAVRRLTKTRTWVNRLRELDGPARSSGPVEADEPAGVLRIPHVHERQAGGRRPIVLECRGARVRRHLALSKAGRHQA